MKALQNLLIQKGYDVGKSGADGVIGTDTLKALQLYLQKEISKRSWIFPKKDFIWLRMDNTLSNTYDDFGCRINEKGIVDYVFPCTTTAGDFWIFNPITEGGITGTGVIAEQQTINSHVFVTDKNWLLLWLKAPYFQQVLPTYFYRDGNRDRVLDKIKTYLKNIGSNWHHGGIEFLIGKWSAACFVTQPIYWNIAILSFNNGDKTTLTLIDTTK